MTEENKYDKIGDLFAKELDKDITAMQEHIKDFIKVLKAMMQEGELK